MHTHSPDHPDRPLQVPLKNPIPLALREMAPLPELFRHHSDLHGQAHVARVIIHAFVLVELAGLREYAARAWAAAYIHDLCRTHDGFCTEHGLQAVRRVNNSPDIMTHLASGGVRPGDWEGISAAVTHHCRQELPASHPHWTLTALLKDADGLDRVRLGDLDVRFLRFPLAGAMVPFAEALYRHSQTHLKPGPDFFEHIWRWATHYRGEWFVKLP